jgi:hypothetical protein
MTNTRFSNEIFNEKQPPVFYLAQPNRNIKTAALSVLDYYLYA